MWVFLAINFLIVTMPNSTTGEGIKFGGYVLIVFAKLIAVYWAVMHIPLDQRRLRIIHIAALAAFLWLALTTLADRFYLIEINDFTRHLPAALAGKWDPSIIPRNSTVSNSHGGTTVTLLVIGALVVGTARHRYSWLVQLIVFVLLAGTSFLSGSRQGLVRIAAFIAIYFTKQRSRLLLFLLPFFLFAALIVQIFPKEKLVANPYYLKALERQSALIDDPFSSESLSGRPILWISVIETLNEKPIRWLIGYGLGNYTEFKNAAHNMFLQFLQDGGLLELFCFSLLSLRIFRRIWVVRQEAWIFISLSGGMLTSFLTSAIFYPTLSTGWYLGLYFVVLHVLTSKPIDVTAIGRRNSPM
jgi:O-antigen ligase